MNRTSFIAVIVLVSVFLTLAMIFLFSENEVDYKQYVVDYVPKETIYPAYGYNGAGHAVVREDLSPRVKQFVTAHELYHLGDTATWGGWIGRELRASIVSGFRDPIGFGSTIFATVTDVDRIGFYLKRIRESR